jgi:hypothetical protein
MVAKLDNAALDFGFTDIDIGTSLAGTTYASRAIRSPFGVSCGVSQVDFPLVNGKER